MTVTLGPELTLTLVPEFSSTDDRDRFPQVVSEHLSEIFVKGLADTVVIRAMADARRKVLGLLKSPPPSWPVDISDEAIENCVTLAKKWIIEEHSAGYASLWFSVFVLAALGKFGSPLSNAQRTMIERICTEVVPLRPLPTIVWANYTRRWLQDPSLLARSLALCEQCAIKLNETINAVVENSTAKLTVDISKPILVWGYSRTILAALQGMRKMKPSLLIADFKLDNRDTSEAQHLVERIDIDLREVAHEVRSSEECLHKLREGQVGLVLMGSKVVGVRETGELEIINSRGSDSCLEEAFRVGTPTAAVTGVFKCWDQETFEKYRVAILADTQHNSLVPGHQLSWIISEVGILDPREFLRIARHYPAVGGMPLLALWDRFNPGALKVLMEILKNAEIKVELRKVSEVLRMDVHTYEELSNRLEELQRCPEGYAPPADLYKILSVAKASTGDERYLSIRKTAEGLIRRHYAWELHELEAALQKTARQLRSIERDRWMLASYREIAALNYETPEALDEGAVASLKSSKAFVHQLSEVLSD